MRVSLEVRDRLAVAVLSLQDFPHSPATTKVSLRTNSVLLSGEDDTGEESNECEIAWPEGGPSLDPAFCCTALLPTLASNNLLVRISLRPSGQIEVLKKDKKEESYWSHQLQWPKCVTVAPNSIGQKWLVRCSSCRCVLSSDNFSLRRCLPLPSISWRESSGDWFCCCTANISDQGKGNKTLATKPLEPLPGDVLFAPGFVCLNVDSLIEPRCGQCGMILGSQEKEGRLLRLWQHSVDVSPEQQDALGEKPSIQVEETFCDLLDGIVSEGSAKVFFESDKRILHVWVLDQNMRLYAGEGPRASMLQLHEKVVTKVMFKEMPITTNAASKEDTFRVPEDVITAGLRLLREGQKWILEGSQDSSSEFQLSYLPKDIQSGVK